MTKLKRLFFEHWRLIFAEIFLVIIALTAIISLNSDSNTISIAVVAPLSGEQEHVGKNIVKTLNIYAERINKYGGIKGYDLIISPYDNKGSSETSREIAKNIADENKSIAVIQDFPQSSGLDIQKIYQAAKIPLILPTTHTQENNQWNFQIASTPEASGRYIANYVKQSLKKDSIIIVQSENKEHRFLVKSFIRTFRTLGGTVKETLTLGNNKESLSDIVDKIISASKQESFLEGESIISDDDSNMLLLAISGKQSVPLIVDLKDKNIDIPIISSDIELSKKFNQYSEGNQILGYFTDGIYATTNILLDSISNPVLPLVYKDYHLQYDDGISHRAISAALSANFVIDSLINSNIEINNVQEIRKNVIKGLAKNDWFDDRNKGSEENLISGVFKQQNLVTALSNSRVISENNRLNFDKSNILKQKGNNRYLTDYVYTGISMNKISNINMDSLTYSLDFFLWFRYSDTVKNANNIEFLNANSVKSIRLLDLLDDAKKESDDKSKDNPFSAKLVEKYSTNGEIYHRYQVKGNFKTNNAKNYALGQQNAYVRFRHYNTNQYHLSYISDFLHSNHGVFSLESNQNNNFDVIDNDSLTLSYNISYIDTSYKTRLGSIKEEQESIAFSEFVSEYRIKPTLSSFRGMVSWVNSAISAREDKIDMALMVLLLAVSWAIFIFTRYVDRVKSFEKTSTYWWFLQLGIIFFILLFSELVISQMLYNLHNSSLGMIYHNEINKLMMYSVKLIAILWWIIPAYYITSAFEHFLWKPIKKRTDAEIPYVLRLVVTVLVYLLAILGIMAYVLEVTISGLAATSGVIAIIFALASKVDLSNIIAGLGISLAKTFKLGDWVKINDVEGQVIEMTPRATKVLTFNSSIINIPNTTVSSAIIENYNRPDPAFRVIIHLEVVPIYRFERVEKVLLDAVSSTEGVLDSPEPFVIFKGQGDSCQIFEVAFFVGDYSQRYGLWQAAWRRIWRHLEQADIALATPQREVFTPKVVDSNISEPCTVLDNCGAFPELSSESKQNLSKKMQSRRYAAGDIILREGEENNSLFIITEGVVSLNNESQQGEIVEVKRLGVAEIFGQVSLIKLPLIEATAVARTDTEVLIIPAEDFTATLHSQEQLSSLGTT